MELTVDDIEQDFQQIIEASSSETKNGDKECLIYQDDVLKSLNIIYQYINENIVSEEKSNGSDRLQESDKEYQAEEILDIFQTFIVNKSILSAMKNRAIVEETECCDSIMNLENRMAKEFNYSNNRDITTNPSSPFTSPTNIVDPDILNETKIRYNILCKELDNTTGKFGTRLTEDDVVEQYEIENKVMEALTQEEANSSKNHSDYWEKVNQHKELLLNSTNKKEYVNQLKNMLQQSNQFVVPLNSFKQKDDILSNPDVSTMHQMAKDIERDVVLINSKNLLHGSEFGYDGICNVIEEEINYIRQFQCTSSTNRDVLLPTFETIDQDVLNNFVGNILFACNRTQSGGDTFDLLNQIFFHSELAILAPDSDNIPPLEILIDCGPYKEHANFRNEFGTYCWAVRATVKAKMIFNICDMSPMDEDSAVWGKVSGCFERLLVMPVKRLSHKTYYYDRGLTDRGVVTIQLSNLIDASGNITNDSLQNQSGKVDLNSINDASDKNDNNNRDNDEDFLDNVNSFIKDDSIVAEDLDTKDENVDVLLEATRNEHLVDKNATVDDANENGWEDEDKNGWEDVDIDEHALDPIYEVVEKNEGEEYDEKNNVMVQNERRIQPEIVEDQDDFIKQQQHQEADNDGDNDSGWGDDDDVFDDLA